MASKSETGYSVFMTNMEKLWQSTVGFGTSYQPGNTDLLPAAIKVELDAERALLKKLNEKSAPWIIAVNEREEEIEVLSTLCRRVWEFTVSSKASANFANDVKSHVKKITGARSTPKIVMTQDDPPVPTEESVKQISASQMGIDNRLNQFDALIQLLKLETAYAPNEADLKTTALEAKHTAITNKNSAVIAASPEVDTARNNLKDKMYFAAGNGAELSGKVKQYLRSAFGPSSWQYKQISGLKLTKPSK